MNKRMNVWVVFAVLMFLLFAVAADAGEKEIVFTWDQPGDLANLAGWEMEYTSMAPDASNRTWQSFAAFDYVQGQTEFTTTQPITSPDGEKITYYFRIRALATSGTPTAWADSDANGDPVAGTIDFSVVDQPTNFTATVQVVSNP